MKNFKLIPIEEVPPFKEGTKWIPIYEKIPIGKALVLSDEEYNLNTVRSGLNHYHKKGRFLNLVFLKRKNFGYLINRGVENE